MKSRKKYCVYDTLAQRPYAFSSMGYREAKAKAMAVNKYEDNFTRYIAKEISELDKKYYEEFQKDYIYEVELHLPLNVNKQWYLTDHYTAKFLKIQLYVKYREKFDGFPASIYTHEVTHIPLKDRANIVENPFDFRR